MMPSELKSTILLTQFASPEYSLLNFSMLVSKTIQKEDTTLGSSLPMTRETGSYVLPHIRSNNNVVLCGHAAILCGF